MAALTESVAEKSFDRLCRSDRIRKNDKRTEMKACVREEIEEGNKEKKINTEKRASYSSNAKEITKIISL